MLKSKTTSTCRCGATLDWLTQEMTLTCGEPCSFLMGKSGHGEPPLPTQEYIEGYRAAQKDEQPEEKNTHWLVLSKASWIAFDNADDALIAHCTDIELGLTSYLTRGEILDTSGVLSSFFTRDDLKRVLIKEKE